MSFCRATQAPPPYIRISGYSVRKMSQQTAVHSLLSYAKLTGSARIANADSWYSITIMSLFAAKDTLLMIWSATQN